MSTHSRVLVAALVSLTALTGAMATASAASAPLGSPQFMPAPDRPVGWRGDGTGRYPGANPPTVWERKKTGDGYAMKGIVYATPMPNIGVSCPIIVGPRVFVTTESADLICLDKQTGRIAWIQSNPQFEGASEEDSKAHPEIAKKLTPLLAQLTKANADTVEQLNAAMATAATAANRPTPPAVTKKREIEKQINDAQLAIDKKLFGTNWAQAVFGFAGPTPTCDGKHVYVFFTTGVSACYDLAGNRKWIALGKGMGSEHGNFASPLLCGNQLIVWANELRGYDLQSGKLTWTTPAKASNTYGSLFRVMAGSEPVAGFQSGFFVRAKDGQAIWGTQAFGDAVATPVVEGGIIFAHTGYPIYPKSKEGLKAFKVPADTSGGKLAPAYDFKTEWAENELPIDPKKNPFDRGFVASPLFVDGLIYQVTQGGGLLVNNAATGELVYRKVLPLKPKTEYWNWAGTSASPTLAGKHIYLMDNQGMTLVIQPGPQYKELATNMLEESRDGKSQDQNVSTPVFEGTRMYYRTPSFLYCIGAQ
jgi:outer membrane protein assembly factor BamB